MHKVGLLLPRSTYYNTIGFDLFEGFRSSLNALGGDDIGLVTENIGFGTEHQNVYRIVEKMLMQENVVVVFAYISHRTAQILRPLFLAANKVLVILDSGANMPQEWPFSPNIFYLSLHNSLGSILSVKKAANDECKTVGNITGYYDGGYLHTFAANIGTQRYGINIAFNHATGYKKDSFTMQPLLGFLEKNPDAFLHTIFSADFVQWFFEEIKKYFPEQNLPPFSLEETMLEESVFPSNKIAGIASWSKTLDNKANKLFIDSLKEKGKQANLFSLLGWEATFIASKIFSLNNEQIVNGRKAGEALLDFFLMDPGGNIFS